MGAPDLARPDIEHQGFRAVPDILKLPPRDVPRLNRQAWSGLLQCLNAGHFVDRDGLHALPGDGGGRLVDGAEPATGRLTRWAHLVSKSGSGLGVSQ